MKIGIVGYGKMGKTVEKIALQRGHEIAFVADADTKDIPWRTADVIIEFTAPEAAYDNLRNSIEAGVPIVSGTTGWLDRREEIERLCREKEGSMLYASNFSIGMNIFFEVNKFLARMMQDKNYRVRIKEIHHIHKLDAPSGTAISLAEDLLPFTPYSHWENTASGDGDALPIESIREGEEKGFHEVGYSSAADEIRISHRALSRDGFALGAVLAAEYIRDKKGVFSMREVLGLNA